MKLNFGILNVASQLASHAFARQGIIAENIANADTPGYRAMDLAKFSDSYQSTAGSSAGMRATRPQHIGASQNQDDPRVLVTTAFGAEAPNGNTVSVEDQIMRGAEVQHQHELALGVYQKSLSILRLGLGRRS